MAKLIQSQKDKCLVEHHDIFDDVPKGSKAPPKRLQEWVPVTHVRPPLLSVPVPDGAAFARGDSVDAH